MYRSLQMLSFFKKILLLKQLLGAGMSREEKNNKKLDLRVNRKHRKHRKHSSCFNLFLDFNIFDTSIYNFSML